MIRAALVACLVTSCWRGDPPPSHRAAPTPARRPANAVFPVATIAAIHECTELGPTALVLRLSGPSPAERLELQLSFLQDQTPLPMTFHEGSAVTISICAFHGCTDSWIDLDELEVGVRARGRYHVAANAGPTYDDTFEATWSGTPWAVRPCPYEMNPP